MKTKKKRRHFGPWCSFCGKDKGEVFTLVLGPCVCICDECVAMATKIVADRKIAAGAVAVIGRLTRSDSQR